MVRIEGEPVKRTYVVTGAASGIGAATARELVQTGARVISCDLHDADVTADLATPGGREELIAEVRAASDGAIDGLVAVAGIDAADPATVRLNFFGTVACLEGLRPMLAAGDRPRAVVVPDSSCSSTAGPKPSSAAVSEVRPAAGSPARSPRGSPRSAHRRPARGGCRPPSARRAGSRRARGSAPGRR
jgi:NAD(P)-dependent dehydrogenase (short-subunit alcohol dehydrogenase family)